MWWRLRILARAGQALLLHVALEAQLLATAFGAVCGKSCASTSTNCEKVFGLCSLPDAMPRTRTIARWNMNGCVSRSALLFCFDAPISSSFDSHLSVDALAVPPFAVRSEFRLPIYANVFGIFSGSG